MPLVVVLVGPPFRPGDIAANRGYRQEEDQAANGRYADAGRKATEQKNHGKAHVEQVGSDFNSLIFRVDFFRAIGGSSNSKRRQ